MITEQFRPDDRPHSLLGFGAMRFPTLPDGSIDEAAAQGMIDLAFAGGVNYFDTAYTYHDSCSEGFLKKALAKYPRESYFLADKLPLWALKVPEDLERIFSEQLVRCGVDYFDYYLTHAYGKSHAETVERLNVIPFLLQKKAEGKIKNLGFSFHDDRGCLEAYLNRCDWDFCQLQLNYADWNRTKARGLYELAVAHNVPVIVMEPVRGGFLANPPQEVAALLRAANPTRSMAGWAMRFVASLPGVKLILSGMSSPEQVTDNLHTFADPGVYLSAEEQAVMARAITVLDSIASIPCTACRYCMPCPFGVEIPAIFAAYNNAMLFHAGRGEYPKSILPAGRADHCTACGACTKRCPQAIAIPTRLAEVHTTLTKKG